MALLPWHKGIVTRIENESYNTKRFWIAIPELEDFDYKPGQFVTLDLPIHEKINKRTRSYSIASWPDGSNQIELVIVLLESGAGSTYMFTHINVGSEITLRGPLGSFLLPDPIETDLYLICTGTGIAPYRSMLHHIKLHNISHKNIYLVYGTRTIKDLLYYDEMKELSSQISNFFYLPTLSREKWEGCCGYVHQVYEDLIQEKKKGGNELPPAQFYLCGWKVMIDEARQRIAALGYDRKSIHLELYG
jgi:glycine betaine catabolism B